MTPAQSFVDLAWNDYSYHNPHVLKIYQLMKQKGRGLAPFDHLSFRTFNHPTVGIDAFAKFLTSLGYQARDEYRLDLEFCYAIHFEHPSENVPKVFVREFILEKGPVEVSKKMYPMLEKIPKDIVRNAEFWVGGRHWDLPFSAYNSLSNASRSAARIAAYGLRPWHFAVDVSEMSDFKSLTDTVNWVRMQGFEFRNEGMEVQGSMDDGLEIAFLLPAPITFEFTDGQKEFEGGTFGFVKRYKDSSGSLFNGFFSSGV